MTPQITIHRDKLIGKCADRQYGVVSRAQLLKLGLSPDMIRTAVRSGRLRPLHRGVYAVGHVALAREGPWMAGLLACGDGSVLSHRTAAAHWRLSSGPGAPVEVITANQCGRTVPQLTARRMALHSTESVTSRRLRVTTPARTIVDLAGVLDAAAMRRSVERAQDLRLFDHTRIAAILERHPRRPGCSALAHLLVLLGPDRDGARSYLERLFLRLVRAARLPLPEVNAQIAGRRRDFVWRDARLVIETDGYQWHSSRAARRRDNRRDRELTAAGWRPIRFTYEEVVFEANSVAVELASLLAALSV